MELSEFKELSKFLQDCKSDDTVFSMKPDHFASVIGSAFPGSATFLVRDYLDVDRTFAVVTSDRLDLKDAVALLQDIKDYLELTLYDKVKNVGLIDLQSHTGFWVLV